MSQIAENNVEMLIEAGAALSQPRAIDEHSVPYVVLPPEYGVHNLESTLPRPRRKIGNAVMTDELSFIKYIQAQDQSEARIYCSMADARFVAVFNDHGPNAGWRDFRVTYQATQTAEWTTWIGADCRQMKQIEFAQFIEDNLFDILEPVAADMLEISRTLEARKKANFSSAVRLSNGMNEFTFEESMDATASKGKLRVPEIFRIAIPVLEGGPVYSIRARLRYRIADGGSMTMWYDLERPHKTYEDAVNTAKNNIAEKFGVHVFAGQP